MRFPRLLTAAALAMYCNTAEALEQDMHRVTEAEINQVTRWRTGEITAWKVVDLKGGEDCIFVYYEGPPAPTFFILKRQDGQLITGLRTQINEPYVVEEINLTDMGNDGKREIEVLFKDGRRLYYIWSGNEYKMATPSHGYDDFYYKDLDRDGTDEVILVRLGIDGRYRTRPRRILDVYKWRHGWTPFEYEPLNVFEREYEAFLRSSPDTLLFEEGHERIRNKIRDYLGMQ